MIFKQKATRGFSTEYELVSELDKANIKNIIADVNIPLDKLHELDNYFVVMDGFITIVYPLSVLFATKEIRKECFGVESIPDDWASTMRIEVSKHCSRISLSGVFMPYCNEYHSAIDFLAGINKNSTVDDNAIDAAIESIVLARGIEFIIDEITTKYNFVKDDALGWIISISDNAPLHYEINDRAIHAIIKSIQLRNVKMDCSVSGDLNDSELFKNKAVKLLAREIKQYCNL